MNKFHKLLAVAAGVLILSSNAVAYSGDLSINSEALRFSDNNFLEGRTVRIYAQATNLSGQDLLGTVRFFDNNKQISGDQPISVLAGKNDSVFIDWTPSFGTHKIAAKVYPWEDKIDDPSNNWIVTEVFAAQDTDKDGIPNDKDNDDDGDGVPDTEDVYPLNPNEQYDTDGDGSGDGADKDDDNDGVPDEFDDLPLDPNETIDTDHDGIGNISDEDDDGDGIKDTEEENTGTDPIKPDSDEDGVNDGEDSFPLNPGEQYDTDADLIGNNTDIDDDNDGIKDTEDPYPLNKGPVIKLSKDRKTVPLLKEYTFDASPSYDDDGEIVSYLWTVNGKEFEGKAVKHIFTEEGSQSIKLTISDNDGEKRSSEFQVDVTNTTYYAQITLTLLTLLLALLIYFKYIAEAKNSKS